MKKITAILAAVAASCAARADYADDVAYFVDAIETSKSVAAVSEYAQLELYLLEMTSPKVFASRADAQPATFVWFLWKIYDNSAPSERLGLLNQIKKLTQ